MVEPKGLIQFEELGLGTVLKRYQLLVPPNQREYAWEDREVKQLLQDFAREVLTGKPYFLGTIVTIAQGDGRLEVVDGQQRLATTVLLLAAIRDYLRGRDDFIAGSIGSEFLVGSDRGARSHVPKLTLNVDDNDFFSRVVNQKPDEADPEPLRSSHHRLLHARTLTRQQVNRIGSPHDEREHGDVLNEWVDFVEKRALVILLKVPSESDAFKMFETLNDRGLRTGQVDLVKNHLFKMAGDRLQEVQSSWSYMRGALESSFDDPEATIDFLRHALIVQRGHLREQDVYDEVQTMVLSPQAAVAFAATLESLANVYVATSNPEHERWNGYPDAGRRAVEVLNLLNIKPLRPLLLAVSARFDPSEAAQALRFLVSLSVRLMIASSTRSSSVEVPLASAAQRVFVEVDEEPPIATARNLVTRLEDLTPLDADFAAKFAEAKISNAKLARYYLRSLEMAEKGEPEPSFIPNDDRQIINLEHVLPRKPEDHWPQFTEDDVRMFATRLGNLALLRASDNSNLKSYSFKEKQQVYEASSYELTSMIAGFEDWDADAINRRQHVLAEKAVETWPRAL
jgi:hypothetical protein